MVKWNGWDVNIGSLLGGVVKERKGGGVKWRFWYHLGVRDDKSIFLLIQITFKILGKEISYAYKNVSKCAILC